MSVTHLVEVKWLILIMARLENNIVNVPGNLFLTTLVFHFGVLMHCCALWASSGSWWWTGKPGGATVHGVTKSWTRLSNWTVHWVMVYNLSLIYNCSSYNTQVFNNMLKWQSAHKQLPYSVPKLNWNDMEGLKEKETGEEIIWAKFGKLENRKTSGDIRVSSLNSQLWEWAKLSMSGNPVCSI